VLAEGGVENSLGTAGVEFQHQKRWYRPSSPIVVAMSRAPGATSPAEARDFLADTPANCQSTFEM
jgi:hypothetical protein